MTFRSLLFCACSFFFVHTPLLAEERANPDSLAAALYAEGNYWKLMEISKQFGADTLSAKFQFYLGMSYAALSETQRALEFLQRSIALDSSKMQYRYQYARVLTQYGLYQSAVDQLTQCIAMDSTYIPAQFQLGLTYAAKKDDPEKEIEIFSSLIERNAKDFLSLYYKADALKRMGYDDSSAIYLQLSLAVNPRYYPALIAISNYLSRNDRHRDAMRYYLRADSLRNDNKDLKYQIGESYRKLGELQKAKQYFHQAIALDSMNGMYHAQLAYTYFSAVQYNSSAAEYRKAILYDEENPQYYLNLALVYKKLQDTPRVVQTYNNAIRIMHPEQIAYAYNDLAAFYYGKNMYREAIETYRRVIDFNPANTEALFFIGMSYDGLAETPHAIQTFTTYLQRTEKDTAKLGMRTSVQRYLEHLKKKKK